MNMKLYMRPVRRESRAREDEIRVGPGGWD